jgi:hypothetical protein
MSIDAAGDWITVYDEITLDDFAADAHRCLWVKITQLVGEVSCYLLPVHDGNHCSADWIEWS